MPEYLAPGVYVEESATGVTPIPGVSTSTIDIETARALVSAIEPVIKRAQPGWTGFNDADPGIALIQLFAWVAEGLLYRSSADPERRRKAVLSAVADVAAAAGGCAIERETLRRPNYFFGKLIAAADLQLEQEYHLEKHRRHNRHLHGFGIVSGLEVRVDPGTDSDGDRIVVEPGYAIDSCGEEIAIPESVRLAVPADGDAAYVTIRHWEHPWAESPAKHALDAGSIEEACIIAIARDVLPSALAISRLARVDGRWTVDAAFVPPRAGV